jgi:asparagine synthase (glutamine-hydrolysing)
MCGIAGIVSIGARPVPVGALAPMCDAIAHRGPDDAGYAFFRLGKAPAGEGGSWCEFADPRFRHVNEHLPVLESPYCREELSRGQFAVALGHRRLSVIDLTHYGHQPMCSSDRRFWVVYNGEIYNFPQLRSDLEAAGHIFRSRSDTEVLLHLWEAYGPASLQRLDGMFAFALYDRQDNALTLARDRFGVKPLYYCQAQGLLLFASEVKAILASGLVQAKLDPQALAEYLAFQNILGTRNLFEGVRILQPGEHLTLRPCSQQAPALGRFHGGFPPAEASLAGGEALDSQVADAFEQAVRRQLISDVPVGSYLSGGMDSGSIVAVAGRSLPRLMTFTGGFDLTNVSGIEQGFDERTQAQQLSYLLQTEHYEVVLHAGDMPAAMEKIAWHIDDPRVGMCHQNWYVAKLARGLVKVCLCGAGGDELFGGYPWRYRQGLLASSFEEFDRAYFQYWHRLLPPPELPQLLSRDLAPLMGGLRQSFDEVMRAAPAWQSDLSAPENMLQRALYFEFKTFLHGFLVIEDHISMAHSLESRVPFLDNALADLAWRIRPSLKVSAETLGSREASGTIVSADGKRILRSAMRRYLPAQYTQQVKKGFSPPDENWYRGESMDYVQSVLLDRRTLERPWLNADFVREKLQEHFDGRRNHRLLIWSLLSLEWLQRHYVDR